MLEVQKYLLSPGKSLETLNSEYGINSCIHVNKDKYPLVILNYDQIESVKSEKIVRECRCLILELGTWELVSKSFNRFFNVGEMSEEFEKFDWNSVYIQTKEDGSLCSLFWYSDKWHITTRGSWAEGNINLCEFSWKQKILEALGVNFEEELENRGFLRSFNYIFEFCSPYNKVVRYYPKTKLYLLSIFAGEIEFSSDIVDYACKAINLKLSKNIEIYRPDIFSFKSLSEVKDYIKLKEKEDATYEGCVLRDKNNERWKLKSSTYLGLSRLKGNDNIWNKRYLIPFILSGEGSELLAYFPEIKSLYLEVRDKVNEEYRILNDLWNIYKNLSNQKEFALGIVGKTRFSNILFQARKLNFETINKFWRDSGDQIYEVLYKGK